MYDSATYDLARAFLADVEGRNGKVYESEAQDLAQVIQDVVEDWFEQNIEPLESR